MEYDKDAIVLYYHWMLQKDIYKQMNGLFMMHLVFVSYLLSKQISYHRLTDFLETLLIITHCKLYKRYFPRIII
jgi:hypothetical protein